MNFDDLYNTAPTPQATVHLAPIRDDETLKCEMIRMAMSELGKRSGEARRRK
tara:strand:+ start:53 stop:208 length:156 start_codon:yes stop_codon:yes gene_type:complete